MNTPPPPLNNVDNDKRRDIMSIYVSFEKVNIVTGGGGDIDYDTNCNKKIISIYLLFDVKCIFLIISVDMMSIYYMKE